MVVLVETIDEVARRLGRDVVFLMCERRAKAERGNAVAWLHVKGFQTEDCLPLSPGWIQYEGFPSEVYIDVENDPSSDKFRMLEEHFENADGTAGIFEGIRLAILSLDVALSAQSTDEI